MSMLVPISREGPLASLQTFPYTTNAGAFIGLFHTNGMNLPRWYCIKSIEKFTVAEPVEMGPVQKK